MTIMEQHDRLGVYVHIPFCRYRCDYCAFITFTDRDHLTNAYVDACVAQLRQERPDYFPPVTLYFGGGTPSKLSPEQVGVIVRAADLVEGAEVSLECNPDDVTSDLLKGYVDAGVTRTSFGVQSTSPRALQQLGRPSPEQSVEDLAAAVQASGLPSWNIDLIYGAAGETAEEFRSTLDRIVALRPPHLSAYALTVEPGTPLSRTPERFPNEDHQADRYEELNEVLGVSGYGFEEISSWSQPGHECLHHDIYWTGGNYLGIGAGAHGHHNGRRYWNSVSPERYIEAIESGGSPVVGEEHLGAEAQALELLTLSLRTAHGVPWEAIDHEKLQDLGSLRDLVERRGDRAVLTVAGRLVANTVVQCLLT
jgi:oxygen-independent coproporphyrinogen-3 oxidase